MAASKAGTKTAPKAQSKPAVQDPISQQLGADDGIAQLRKQYINKAREKLRARVLPELETVITMTPSGPTRNKLTDAQVILLHTLEDLSS